jgi:hypothetical protein
MAERTGDRGQRYAVSCLGFDGENPGERKVIGWTNQADGGGLVDMIELHPTWNSPLVHDRENDFAHGKEAN